MVKLSMKRTRTLWYSPFQGLMLMVFLLVNTGCSKVELRFNKLLVEYAENPINIDIPNPRFSWIIASAGRNQTQQAFRLFVASSGKLLSEKDADLWDSGKISSSETLQHEYGGRPLETNHKYYWKAHLWDGKGKKWESPVAWFETANLENRDWKASWIGNGPSQQPLPDHGFFGNRKEEAVMEDTVIHNGRSLLLRKEVSLSKKVRSAKAFVTGLGYYEFFVNGRRAGDYVLNPAKTPYHRFILYDGCDITGLLQKGKNVLGLHLGNGWYNPYKNWWNQYRMQWFGHKKALAQIHVVYNDGSEQVIVTDESWKWADGPVLFNCVYDGEVYDGNSELPGWNSTGFDESAWKPVTVFENPVAGLVSQRMPPIQVNQDILPREIKVAFPGMKVFDMGQNFGGWVSVKAKGKKNIRLKIRFAEDIHEDGTIDASSNENARATAEYIMKGQGIEKYEPSFTFFGFRYVEITSGNEPYELVELKGRVVHSANEQTGFFECDNELVNKIHKATVWSQKSNMMGYPMDCPQRDERLGWMGDAQVTAEEALFNFDMARFYENWLEGIKENQDKKTGDLPIISPQPYMPDEGIEWSSTYIMLSWLHYQNFGDTRFLASHYPVMKKYMEYLATKAKDHILPMGWIGDWGSLVKGWKEGHPESVPTAYYFLNAGILSKIAGKLGFPDDEAQYRQLAGNIREAYNKKYLNAETGNYLGGTQMDNAFPLCLGLVPDSLKSKVLANLIKDISDNGYHLTTGVLGTKYMPEALAQMGRADVAWKIINQKTYPGWNEMMKKYTTTCEFWTLKQSKNHVMMGSIDAWFYKYLAGIQLNDTSHGYRSFTIKPQVFDDLNHVNARIETIRGTVSSQWESTPDLFTLKVEIPFGCSATLYIPGNQNDTLTERNHPINEIPEIKYLGYNEHAFMVKVNSGRYIFEVKKQ